jgi:hypothetical protein
VRTTPRMKHSNLQCLAPRVIPAAMAITLIACGGVEAISPDATPDPDAGAPDAPAACTPSPCTVLSDDFNGASLDPAVWSVVTAGGATVALQNGMLRIRLPAAADAWADVFTHMAFPVGATFEASVTLSAGQFYDHKGIGFASGRIGATCDAGESDSVMFRGQDDDGYVQTKAAHVAACSLAADTYQGGTRTLRIQRLADQVLFRQDSTQYPPARSRLPTMPLPVRFSAYTYTTAPAQPVQIDIDWMLVTTP